MSCVWSWSTSRVGVVTAQYWSKNWLLSNSVTHFEDHKGRFLEFLHHFSFSFQKQHFCFAKQPFPSHVTVVTRLFQAIFTNPVCWIQHKQTFSWLVLGACLVSFLPVTWRSWVNRSKQEYQRHLKSSNLLQLALLTLARHKNANWWADWIYCCCCTQCCWWRQDLTSQQQVLCQRFLNECSLHWAALLVTCLVNLIQG